ncbi:MAG: C25 family cysteine peptidase [Kiritimatiellae bacterium]|nr:C25 family cysteine peptidase [Kiritimatiellia bacterium]MDW8459144.1 C25 family cysteine peptidase [Verrucomicrobiota bacterium]
MTNGSPQEFAVRRAGADWSADRRIEVSREGLFRISYSALAAAGITNPIGSQLRLFCRTQEIALAVSSSGPWTTNDHAVFFGRPHINEWTSTNVYWLAVGGSGLRMLSRNVAPQHGWPERTSHWRTVITDENRLFVPSYRPQDPSFDHWMAYLLTNTPYTTVTASTPARILASTALVTFAFWGRTATSNDTRISINDVWVHTARHSGANLYLTNLYVPAHVLNDGVNTLRFEQIYAGPHQAWLDWFSFTYEASNRPFDGALGLFGVAGSNTYRIIGWNTNHMPWLLDVSNPAEPVILTNYLLTGVGVTGSVVWSDAASGSNRYWVAAPHAIEDVAISQPVYFQNLGDTHRTANYLIIAHPSLATGAYALARHRSRDGLRTLLVPIDGVYNEFSYGIKDARAIKQFLGYAFHHWAAPPKYALLVGDGSFDPKNYLGLPNPIDLVPVWMLPAPFDRCAQDGAFACVNGADLLRDIQIGRLPATNHANVTAAVARIIGFENSPTGSSWRFQALAVADLNKPFPEDFQTASDTFVVTNLLHAGVPTVWRAYEGSNSAVTRAMITNTINAVPGTGPVFSVSYFGHGSPTLWNAGAFSTTHVQQLNNSVWPVVSVFTCDNGDFANPRLDSMAEIFLRRPQRGASAFFGPSALSVQEAAKRLADGFFKHLTNAAPRKRLGDMVDRGMLELTLFSPDSEEHLFYHILGDPAQVVKP